MDLAHFLPQPGRGAAVDKAVRNQLASSLVSLYQRAGRYIDFDDTRLQRVVDDILRQPCRPAIFATYTDLVESIGANDLSAAQELSNQLLALEVACPKTQTVTLSDDDLGQDQAQRYMRIVNDDPEEPVPMQAVPDKASASMAVKEALSLIEAANPMLAAEICELAHEVVVAMPVVSTETGETVKFDGASTFYLWGAVFLRGGDRLAVDLAQTLAHETGHLLLFGLMMGQPLVENDYVERYKSPLRSDPRPMEGLVHAAYVLARMHYCLDSLVRADTLSLKGRTFAQSEMEKHRSRFSAVKARIDDRARFTRTGAEIFDSAVEYMQASPKPVAAA